MEKEKKQKPVKERKNSKKVTSSKNNGLGVRKKITLAMSGLIMAFVLLLGYLAMKAVNYSERYSSVLDNITKITYIKKNCADLAPSLVNMCNFYSEVDDDTKERIQKINDYYVEIGSNIGDNPENSHNQNMYEAFSIEVKKFLDSYNEIVEKCGDVFSPEGTEIAEKMAADNSFLTSKAEQLLAAEISRSELERDSIHRQFKTTIISVIIVSVVVIILAVTVTIFITASIVNPVVNLQKNLTVIADGDLTSDNIKVRSKDEVGMASQSFNKMKESLVQIISKVKESVSSLHLAVERVNSSVEENAKGSVKVSNAMEEMLINLENQQAQVEELVAQSEEMNNISYQVAGDADAIYKSVMDAQGNAKDGMEKINAYVGQMEEVNRSMREMEEVFASFGESTQEMATILSAIVDISVQTNLLSLNASIEAARAGDAGMGFAVVADEIRKLADDSQKSASQIGKIVSKVEREANDMQEKLQSGLECLRVGNAISAETKTSFEGIWNETKNVGESVELIIKRVDRLNEKISSTKEGVDVISKSAEKNLLEINDISAFVTEESENLSEVASAMGSVLGYTNEMENMVSAFVVKEVTNVDVEKDSDYGNENDL